MNTSKTLSLGLIQWLPTPGAFDENVATALRLIREAANHKVDLVMLPELWLSGYDVDRLGDDVANSADELTGPRLAQVQALAKELGIWIVAGSVGETTNDGIYNTAVVFNRLGEIAATHRKAHLYTLTGEDEIFSSGDSMTTFHDDELGTVGLSVCFDGDFPSTAQAFADQGVDVVLQPNAYEFEAGAYWDLYYPAAAIAHGQWWVLGNQCGTNKKGTLLGSSRIIDPTGAIVAEGARVQPGSTPGEEIIYGTIASSPEIEEAKAFAALLR